MSSYLIQGKFEVNKGVADYLAGLEAANTAMVAVARTMSGSSGMGSIARREAERLRQGSERFGANVREVEVLTQLAVVEQQGLTRVRPAASDSRLKEVTLSPHNRMDSAGGFGVGSEDWLSGTRSGIIYALQIELGTVSHLGQHLMGVWEGGGTISGFERGRHDQRFIATSYAAARALVPRGEGPVTGQISVLHPIKAQHDYQRAYSEVKPQRMLADSLRRAFGFR